MLPLVEMGFKSHPFSAGFPSTKATYGAPGSELSNSPLTNWLAGVEHGLAEGPPFV